MNTPTGKPPGRPRKTQSDTDTELYPKKNSIAEPTFMASAFDPPLPKEEAPEILESIETSSKSYDEPELPLQARPVRKKTAISNEKLPTVAFKVYALVTTGLKGKIDHVPLHEIPLLRRKLFLQDGVGEKPQVMAEWQDIALERTRPMTSLDVREEYKRLQGNYKFDKPNGKEGEEVNLLADFYGTKLRDLIDVMNRMYRGYNQIMRGIGENEQLSDEQLEELVNMADPDFDLDFTNNDMSGDIPEYESFEPKGPGSVISGTNSRNARVTLQTT